MSDFRIETERLILREWCAQDRAPFREMARDPEVMRFLPALTLAGADAMADRMAAFQAGHGSCFWALETREDGRFIGFCGIMPPRPPLVELEIGWRLERAAWGKGLAFEAARASLDWVWKTRADETVVAITVPANERSWCLMERLGMSREPSGDFDHPALPAGDPLRRHILYRIARPR
jgi:RimJ/RimL family protein N-acetyltransferase